MRRARVVCLGLGSMLISQACFAGGTGRVPLAVSLAGLTTVVPATQPLPEWAKIKQPVPRKALVIGIGTYDHATQLSTPTHDADIVASTLTNLGFRIKPEHLLKGRLDRASLLLAIRQFTESLSEGDVAFVFFSGHGVERDGVNYLVPSSGEAYAESPGHDYVPLTHLLGLIEESKVAAATVILDACRADPFSSTNPEDRDQIDLSPIGAPDDAAARAIDPPSTNTTSAVGLAEIDTGPPAMLLAYAAQPDRPAYSLFKGEEPKLGSIFTRTVANRLQTSSNYPVRDIFSLAETDVYELTKQKQKPFQNPFGMLYLMLADNVHIKGMEEESWARTVATTPTAEQVKLLRDFLRFYPGSEHSFAARRRLAELTAQPDLDALARKWAGAESGGGDFAVFGKLQSISRSSDGSDLAGANQNVVLRQNWDTILKSRPIGTINSGEVVKVLEVHRSGDAVRVLTNEGKVGWVGDVGVTSMTAATETAHLIYPGEDPSAEAIDWAPLDQLSTKLAAPNSIAKIRTAKGNGTGLSDQVAQLRALRLRDALVARGVSAERVMIEPPDSRLPSQTAEIELVEAIR